MHVDRVGTVTNLYANTVGPGGPGAVVTRITATTPQDADEDGAGELFVGRGDETEAVLAALAPGTGPAGVPVCAVQGMGGIGKSALVRRAAALAVGRDWFPGGAVVVDLHGYDPDPAARMRPAQVFAPALRVLGMPPEQIPAAAEAPTAYHQWLEAQAARGRRALLVLDNAADLAQVHDLLPTPVAARTHRVLITSRDTLPVPGATPLELGVLTPDEAGELLRAALDRQARVRGRAADPRSGAEPAAAAEVVRRCGRLPLAVVIAAGVLAGDPDLGVAELAQELADTRTRLAALDDGTGGVHTAFVTSWQRLRTRDPAAARVLCLLTAAPGPDVDLAAAAALAGVTEPEARLRLRALTRAHLLLGRAHRWSCHDLVRLDVTQHAVRDLPVADDELAAALERLLAHYVATAGDADDWVRAARRGGPPAGGRFADLGAALAWFDTERANLVAAVTDGAAADGNAERDRLVVDLSACVVEFLTRRRQVADRVTMTEAALVVALRLSDLPRMAIATQHLGTAFVDARQFDDAISVLTHVAQLYRDTGNGPEEANARNNLGLALRHVGRFAEAITAHTTARDLARKAGDRAGEAGASNNLGSALVLADRLDEAAVAYTAAAGLHRKVGDRRREAETRNNLGILYQRQERFEEAVTAHTGAAEVFREVEDRHGEGMAANNLSILHTMAGRFPEAINSFRVAVSSYRETADPHGEAEAWTNGGAALELHGQLPEALHAYAMAGQIFGMVREPAHQAVAELGRGRASEQLERFEEAATAYTTAADLCRDIGDRCGEGALLSRLSDVLSRLGRPGEQRRALERAAAAFTAGGDEEEARAVRRRLTGG